MHYRVNFIAFKASLFCLLMGPGLWALAGERPVQSGIAGRITVSPSCPGPQKIDQEACRSPLAGAVVELRKGRGAIVGKVTTDADGRFQMNAPTGVYTLRIDVLGMYPRCPETGVTVTKLAAAPVEVTCDSGMR